MNMDREGHKDVVYFVGGEVEKTPAYSKKTLFVVGIQDAAQVERVAREYKTPHVFLGANHSFDAFHYTDHFGKTWNELVTSLLDKGFWVTLDYPAHQHETVLKMLSPGVWQSRLFVPLLSVRIPNIQTSSPNLTVKIDDIDFKATNPGVWCMHFHEVTDSNRFTDWLEYGTDAVITLDDKPTPMPPYVATVVKSMTKPVDLADLVKVESFAEVNAPGLNLNGLREKLAEMDEVKNDPALGLDVDAKTSLKPSAEEVVALVTPKSAAEAAEMYADGATSDPLSKEGSKKGTKKK